MLLELFSFKHELTLVFFLFLIYDWAILILAKRFFPSANMPLWLCALSGVFASCIFFVTLRLGGQSEIVYSVAGIILLCQLIFFVRKDFFVILFFVCSVCITIISIRAIVFSVYSLVSQVSLYHLSSEPKHYSIVILIVVAVLTSSTLAAAFFFPSGKMLRILERRIFRTYMFSWVVIVLAFLFYNMQIYKIEFYDTFFVYNQIAISVTMLGWFYFLLAFATVENARFELQEQNQSFAAEVLNNEEFRKTIIQENELYFEVNLTKNRVISGYNGYEDILRANNDLAFESLQAINLISTHPDHQESVKTFIFPTNIMGKFYAGESMQSFNYLRKKKNEIEKYEWVRMVFSVIRCNFTSDLKAYMYVVNIDEEVQKSDILLSKAQRDSLTGLYNKEYTEVLISEKIGNGNCVLMLIDVDNFKNINDSMGHSMGDEVLRHLSVELKKIFRSEDVVGRIGGDEFMAFMVNIANEDVVMQRVNQIIVAFRNTYSDLNGVEHSISSSIGVYLVPLSGVSFDEAYQKADVAMYQSKRRGKNGYTVYRDQAPEAAIVR